MDRCVDSLDHGMLVRTRGAASGRTIVYLHGLGESGLCFERLTRHPALAGFRHVVPDLPGYGRSAWPARAMGLDEVADHVAGWLDARGAPAPIVVGHSMGGVVGVLLAERAAHAVGALVNVEGNVTMADCTFSGRAVACALVDFERGGFEALRDHVHADGVHDPALRGYHASMCFADPRTFHRHAQDLVAASQGDSMLARLAALRVPLVYVAGVPGGAAARSLELLDAAGLRVVRVSPAGHWPFIDQPDAVAAVLAGVANG